MSEEQPTTFGGFPIPTKNFFHLPNNMTDIIARIDNLSELKIVLYLARHTWGFQEYGIYKTISVDEFVCGRKQKKMGPDGKEIMVRMDEGTGLSEPSVKDGLKRGIKHGYILCKVDDKDQGRVKKYYTLRMMASEEEGGKNLTGQESYPVSNLPSEVKNLTPRGKESYPRTEKETKESNSRKTKRENALSSIDETRTLSSSLSENSSSSLQESVPSQAPSQSLTEATAPLSEENGTTEPALPEIEAEAQGEHVPPTAQSVGQSTKQEALLIVEKDTGKAPGKPGKTSSKPAIPELTTEFANDDERSMWNRLSARERPFYVDMDTQERATYTQWCSLFTSRPPLGQAMFNACRNLAPATPTAEMMKNVRKFCFAVDKKSEKYPKGYYKSYGVKLWDVAEKWSDWEGLQEQAEAQKQSAADGQKSALAQESGITRPELYRPAEDNNPRREAALNRQWIDPKKRNRRTFSNEAS